MILLKSLVMETVVSQKVGQLLIKLMEKCFGIKQSVKGVIVLVYGWTVKTGYDLSGGNVTCGNFDCSRYGGVSFWRGKASKTSCQDWDCYGKGWVSDYLLVTP